MSWMITGGAGYIGSHVTMAMIAEGENVVVYDDLSTGFTQRVEGIASVVVGDIRNKSLVESTIKDYKVTGIIHLAAKKSVEESKLVPEDYDDVNHLGTRALLEIAEISGVESFVFSSSAAVYGNVSTGIAGETTTTSPISPYGESKLKAEEALKEYLENGKIRGISLRYFNVAGATSKQLSDASISNLIPIVLDDLASKRRPRIYGNNYPTRDGTCIRDFVDVRDIARAHVMASRAIITKEIPVTLNIGTGIGSSVREIIDLLVKLSASSLDPIIDNPRLGDPASLIADVTLARKSLKFASIYSLRETLESAVKCYLNT